MSGAPVSGAPVSGALSHPALAEVLRRRQGSERRGRLALCVEGGGMRGAISAGMLAALEHLGIGPDLFDLVIGSSAGAMNAAYFVSEQARFGTPLYFNELVSPALISVRRALVGRPVLDLDYMELTLRTARALDADKVVAAGTFRCVATSTAGGAARVLGPAATSTELFAHLRASASIPFVTGRPRPVGGEVLVDASLSEAVPWETPWRLGYDAMVVLATRPLGSTGGHDRLRGALGAAWSVRHPAPMRALVRERQRTNGTRTAFLVEQTAAGGPPPGQALYAIAPRPGDPTVGQLARHPQRLREAAIGGFNAVLRAFDRPAVERFDDTGLFEPQASEDR